MSNPIRKMFCSKCRNIDYPRYLLTKENDHITWQNVIVTGWIKYNEVVQCKCQKCKNYYQSTSRAARNLMHIKTNQGVSDE